MDKKDIKKNILDLEYKKYLQMLNISLILGTTGLIPFLISFVWYKDRVIFGLSITAAIMALAYIWYKITEEKLEEISKKIEEL
ncbi:hypothetical protein J4404_00225 [Candidatus Woesearchaeota archaeon]|nr:hypothetical protein [Candidatus Woesearchaeota archaeon]